LYFSFQFTLMIPESDNYYLSKDEPNQGCLLALRRMILDYDNNITESIKWGIPCFSFKNRMFVFLSIDKQTKYPYLLWVEGNRLSHPLLEQGKRAKMKVFHVAPNKDIDVLTLKIILKEAISFYKKGLIKTK